MAFAQIYHCVKHGETINVFIHEEIDTENDEIYIYPCCSICFSEVTPVLDKDGKPVFRPLTEEELHREMYDHIL